LGKTLKRYNNADGPIRLALDEVSMARRLNRRPLRNWMWGAAKQRKLRLAQYRLGSNFAAWQGSTKKVGDLRHRRTHRFLGDDVG
jgi:hypothetical protein